MAEADKRQPPQPFPLSTSGRDGAGLLWAQVPHRAPDQGCRLVGRRVASDRTSRWTTRRKPKPSMPGPSHTTLPSRKSSPSEAPPRSLVPKVIALASATKAVDLPIGVDEDVALASALLLSLYWLQPEPGSVRTPTRATYLASHRTTTRICFRPL